MSKWTKSDTAEVSGQVPPYMKDNYTLRVLEATSGSSKSSGNPMITLKAEIVRPEKVKRGNKEYNIGGMQVMYYLPFSDKMKGQILDLYERLGLGGDIDLENLDAKPWEGMVFDAILDSEEDMPQKKVVAEDGKVTYEAIKDAAGQPVKRGFKIKANIQDILNISTVELNRAY